MPPTEAAERNHPGHTLRPLLSVLLLLIPALSAAEEPTIVPKKRLSAISLLPDGSQLQGVIFPRYDINHRLLNVLKARSMTLVNVDTISGETVAIEFFDKDQRPSGRVDLTRALFNQAKGLLEAREPVTLQSDRLRATGSGLYYAYEQTQGFLLGPVTTWIKPATETTMHSSNHSPLRTAAVLGMSLLSLPLAAAPPPVVSAREIARIEADGASQAAVASVAATSAGVMLAKDTRDAAAATLAATTFVATTGGSVANAAPFATPTQPLDVTPGPADTTITCEGGMYFDAEEGVFVYFKNVHVTDPQFSLSGANELKIFLAKKPAEPAGQAAKDVPKDPKATAGIGLGAKFGDVDRIVASGAVRVLQKETEAGKEPVEGSGALFTYHTKTGQIILSGGYPWVKQGTTFMRAKQPNLNLRILKTGSFVTEGDWDMGGRLDRK